MDDEIDSLVLSVRADTRAFQRDVTDMRRQLDGPLAEGAAAAGSAIEGALSRAARTGKFGFDDLKQVAVSALTEIAASALNINLTPAGAGGGGLGGGLLGLASSLFGGAPGRATGGEVVGGRPYMVGERGPELFVPTAAGRIETGGAGRGPTSITVNVNAPADASPQFMARSGRQIARELRRVLESDR